MWKRAVLFCFMVLAGVGEVFGQGEWSQFRGASGTGVAAEGEEYLAEFGVDKNLLWKCGLPKGHSSPCIWGDYIFLTGYANFRLDTICIRRSTGKVLWRKAAPVNRIEKVHQVGSPASSTCCTDGERVYVYFGSYGLVCYDIGGKQLWQRPMLMPENLYGSASSPILAGGKLIFLDDQELQSRLVAIDPRSGKTIWERERMGFKANWSTPMYWQNEGVDELVVYGTMYVIGYDLNDGLERWTIAGITHEPCITPVAGEGLVFISSYCMNRNKEILGPPKWSDLVEKYDKDEDGELSYEEIPEKLSILSRYDDDGEGDHPLRGQFEYLDVNKDRKLSGREYNRWGVLMNTYFYENAIMGIRPGNVEEARPAEIVWKQTEGVPEVPSPLYYEGRVYTVKNGGIVTCQVAATGERKYSEKLGTGGPYYGSLVAGDGKIFAVATRGVVTVFEAGDEFKILAVNKIGERIMATPALVEGKIYVRTEKSLFAFGKE